MNHQEFCDRVCRLSEQIFADCGRVELLAALLGTRHPETRQLLDEPQLFVIAPDEPAESIEKKDLFAVAVRSAARALGATTVALVMEAWMVQPEAINEPLNRAKIDALLDMAPSEHPDRVEIVTVTVETKNGTTAYTAPIERDADGKGRLLPFTCLGKQGRMEGRLSRFLPEHYAN